MALSDWKKLISQHLGRKALRRSEELMVHLLLLDCGFRPAWLLDFGVSSVTSLRGLLGALKLAGFLKGDLLVVTVGIDVLIVHPNVCNKLHTSGIGGDDAMIVDPVFVDVSAEPDCPKVISSRDERLKSTLACFSKFLRELRGAGLSGDACKDQCPKCGCTKGSTSKDEICELITRQRKPVSVDLKCVDSVIIREEDRNGWGSEATCTNNSVTSVSTGSDSVQRRHADSTENLGESKGFSPGKPKCDIIKNGQSLITDNRSELNLDSGGDTPTYCTDLAIELDSDNLANPSTLFGLFLHYPVIYIYDMSSDTQSNCLAMMPLVHFAVKGMLRPSLGVDNAAEDKEITVWSFTVPKSESEKHQLEGLVMSWFQGKRDSLTWRDIFHDLRLERKVVQLPAVCL